MSSETDPALWEKATGWLWGLLVPLIAWIWKKQESELNLQRTYIAKIFDKLEEHSERDAALFREVMGKMSDNHSEILRELGRKVDR